MKFHLDNMKCGGCAGAVTAAIQSVDPEARVVADPPNRLVQIDTKATSEQIVAALRSAGSPPRAQ
jgi:copper chaperone